ncbi:MAG TPA: anti-sigma factor [Bacteroidia bacterium]
MNIQTYIESGILERFVMGETDERESREVMDLAAKHPEISNEIARIEDALFELSSAASVQPKADTKSKLMDELFGQDEIVKPNPQINETRIVPIGGRSKGLSKWLVAASVALIASVAVNVTLYSKLQTSETAYLSLVQEKQELAANQKVIQAGYEESKQRLERFVSNDMMRVTLKGVNSQPQANASVFYDSASGEVFLHVAKVDQIPSDKQLQLWAIVDGKPVDAGVYDASTGEAIVKMKSSAKPSAFAITIEKSGGSQVPTLDQMILFGQISS